MFALHLGGKLEVVPRTPLRNRRDLSLAYTPGVAQVSRAIAANPDLLDVYTGRANSVAVVSDGTAVLGLGDIGPAAAMPVMEGKALLSSTSRASTPSRSAWTPPTSTNWSTPSPGSRRPSAGSTWRTSPRRGCFEVERRLQERLSLPVFHDDQHGTAVVVLAALTNACRVVDKRLTELRVVISGAGAAGIAIANILRRAGSTTSWSATAAGSSSRVARTSPTLPSSSRWRTRSRWRPGATPGA